MTTRSIECPSGLKGTIRGLKTKEANILADMSNARKGDTFDNVLKSCWVQTDDVGIYAFDGTPDWKKVLVCDRFYTLVQLRIATYGSEYAFKVQCTSEACREKFEWELDLGTDLVHQTLPEDSKDAFRKGNKFQATIPATGQVVTFRLPTGETERAATVAAKARRSEMLTIALASRILEIQEVHANDRVRFLENLDMGDSKSLIEQMDVVDGGYDTDIEVECKHCNTLQEITLPLGRDFWIPIRRSKPEAKELIL